MNIIVAEMVKTANVQKQEMEMELSQFIEIHEFVDKCASNSRHVSGTKRPGVRPSVSDVADKVALGSTKAPERTPLLATSSIHQLLQLSLESLKLDNSKNDAASQRKSQPSSGTTRVLSSKILSRVLHMCFHQLKSFSSTGKDDPFKTLIYGEIKLLGPPLLNIIFSLKSVPKEAKGQKDVEYRKDNIHLALLCLKKIIEISLSSTKYAGLIDDLVSTCQPDENVAADACCDDDGMNDRSTRSKELLLKKIKPLLSEFLEFSFFREAEILCDMVLMIGTKLPEERRNLVGYWATQLCRRSDASNSKVAKCLVLTAVTLSSPPEDLVIAENMAAELVKVVGSEGTDPVDMSETFPIINKSTSCAISTTILQMVESSVADMDWITIRLKAYNTASQKGISLIPTEKVPLELAVTEILYPRAEAVVKILSHFVAMNLNDPQAELLVRLAARFYKNLARISKLQIGLRGCKQLVIPSPEYEKLVETTCRILTAPVYDFVAQMQKKQQESNKVRGIVSKIKRENRCIPELIFQIEDYEKYLIQLSKMSKVNLLRHAKRSTSRDFKILQLNPNEDSGTAPHQGDHPSPAAEDEDEDEGEGEGEGEGEDEDEAALPRVKRSKATQVVQNSSDEEA